MLTILLLVAIGAFATNEIVYSPIRPRPPRPLPRLITDGGDFISIKLCVAHTLPGIQPEDVFTIVEGFGLESDLIPLYSRKPYWERNSNYDMTGWEYAQPTDHRWTAKIFGGPKNGIHFVIATAPEGGRQTEPFLPGINCIHTISRF